MVALTSMGMLVVGVVLIAIAPKIVGMVTKILGFALIAVGGALYLFPERLITAVDPNSTMALIIAALPAVAGLFVITVGQGMAKMAVRVAGAMMLISALTSMGIIQI
ncbi:MAG: hypothetical protein V3V92_04865 [Candidatus Hydrothermarchaeales archaeon]